MKRSLVTSAVFHILVLVGAMLTLTAPAPLETPESTAMDVDIVTADQLQQGEKKAPVTDHVSRKQTTKQDQVANAQNVGENNVDIKNPVVPTQRPESDTAALAPKKVDAPVPQNDPRPNDVKTIEQKDTEAAPKEVAAVPQQKPDVTPTPTPKTDPTPPTPKADVTPTPPPTEQPTQQAEIPVPNNVPVPDVKPQPTPPKTAEQKPEVKPAPKPDVKVADAKPTDKTTTQSTSKTTSADDGKKDADKKRESAKGSNKGLDDGLADEIANVLSNTSSKGGAKRSSQQASAGADTQVSTRGGMKSLGGGKLSQSQQDGLRDLIAKYWNLMPGLEGAGDVRIKVHFRLDKSGQIVGEPEATTSGGPASTQSAMQSAAVRAVMRAQSDYLKVLPVDKYDDWQEVVVNFSAADLGM
ncbi:hypothetical protein MOV66_10050 [Agrobacterium sp. SHOUNA12C]|uniref:Signal peptide protein n=2 Tax=Rhizobium rhizogenes TaxID=359 RepID=B9J9H7_RHIR8|nr:hypothetical protein [Rhizobium rhizogenes]ACM27579.1 signal peptide protein [Rhizobium rhizogenes K84]MCJ9720756.1 hypothetical protein [Agrobacterium sp. BETTINA12B]MCJ9756985.1 hypothetical protein [Agrobacterium sp. SHOUNA12C]OCI92253.1 hypothetical protein A6U85_22605 [Agrobacterium sp. 13-626]KEA05850.1 signal peptide protein [Rhizobium rhizogenes]